MDNGLDKESKIFFQQKVNICVLEIFLNYFFYLE